MREMENHGNFHREMCHSGKLYEQKFLKGTKLKNPQESSW